ncbi:MAG: AAA family ATPase, partial [Isosphaeraceae bacterium]
MLESFFVNNYKCLVDVTIPLTPIHVIIGQNDSGKTSLLEAMLALYRSTEKPLAEAFPGEWKGPELVFAGAEKPVVQFEARFGAAEEAYSPLTYHLDVKFDNEVKKCKRIYEWSSNGEKTVISEHSQGYTGVACRSELKAGLQQDHLDAIAERFGTANLYRLDPQMMAIPAAIDPNRKFRMDPDGFGLSTLLDDILSYDPEGFIRLRREFCSF